MKLFLKGLFCFHERWESTKFHLYSRAFNYKNTCKECGKVRYSQELPVSKITIKNWRN